MREVGTLTKSFVADYCNNSIGNELYLWRLFSALFSSLIINKN